MTETESR